MVDGSAIQLLGSVFNIDFSLTKRASFLLLLLVSSSIPTPSFSALTLLVGSVTSTGFIKTFFFFCCAARFQEDGGSSDARRTAL